MKKKEPVPTERTETIRHELASLISGSEITAKELSPLVGVSEKEVYTHLEHIRRSFGSRFVVSPATCRRCGYEFKGRTRLTKPSRCPKCKHESIEEAAFSIA